MKTIFIVDDSDTNLAAAESALEDFYNVMTIPSAAKMFSLLEKIKPDLILLDIEMPVKSGFEALKQLKSGSSWADNPVIFLTGTINASIEEQSKELGAVDIITKPFQASIMIDRIQKYI